VTENKAWGQGTGDTSGEGSGSQTQPPVDVTPSEQGTEGTPEQGTAEQATPSVTWVSLREANTLTGVSTSTLRKWYRIGKIKTQDVKGKYGDEKRVILEEVQNRAETLKITAPPEPVTTADAEPREEEAPAATLALVEAIVELSGKYAEAEGGRQRAEEKVGHLESQLKEQRAVSEEKVENLKGQLQELKAAAIPISAQQESQKSEPRSIGAWWRNRGRRGGTCG